MLKRKPLTFDFDYSLHRSPRRRTLEIQVRGAEVRVRAPTRVSQQQIDRFLWERRHWVQEKLAAHQQQLLAFPPRQFVNGATWWWLGEPLTLVLAAGGRGRVQRRDEQLLVLLSARQSADAPAALERLLSDWYKAQAQQILAEKSAALAARLGLQFSAVRLRKTRSRWGHCTSQGVLQYNWLIVQAPESVVDYLVAHEVCHLRHFNHSRAFWDLVAEVCPDYARQRQWLKENGAGLWF
ncbi:SprT family zinc-dependent metalloprotease [Halioxenophilus sp. WMMB6]|uniref:M48 family metallopeptidase n=1 Tax=Halioxenophilus sp. WMMB6 TaxID=3073815 RepID=UPI00295F166F|nr:SprT family zinc-dependent metalloprotease [Halioxenophilus sp. WMMB6]